MSRTGESIYKRKDGRYEARYIVGRNDNGRAIYKSAYGKSKAEVREKVEVAKRKIYGEPSPIEGKTFKEIAEEYLEDAKGKIAATTFDRYLDALERDIYPEYAKTPMKDVTVTEMNRFLKVAMGVAAKRGRKLQKSGLQVIKAVMSNVINFANAAEGIEKMNISWDINSYEELTIQEMEIICLKAKHNHCPEMLAALLALFCGMRNGELCALKSEDVDSSRNEIYIHEIAHRVRNPKRDELGEKKTIVIIEEIPWKNQIRRVSYPAILNGYIDEFRMDGKTLIRTKNDEQTDPRTMENWLNRIMSGFRIKGINFERLRKTYTNGKADEQILNNIFLGVRPDTPYRNYIDETWLTDELGKDLMSLRLLVGMTIDEAADIVGLSTGAYRLLENGSKQASWDQYMALLFLYHYNMRTTDIVNSLGLYPDSLREKMKIGEGKNE